MVQFIIEILSEDCKLVLFFWIIDLLYEENW